ncbi:MAG TPA: YwiC-like family protein [Nitrospirota bacterium]|nr:YwiC-like family protein [Nitrospirota bacterium]
MRNETKGYFLKEYGSWSVLTVAFITGLAVSGEFTWKAIPVFLSLVLLVNSKQAFMKWSRRPEERTSLEIFFVQVVIATIILLAIFGRNVPLLLPLLVFPAAYLLSNKLGGEHFIITELLGFALLSLAAVLAKFLIVEGVDVRLFVAVALYFTAGVFKVKVLLLKKTRDRVLTALYVVFVAYAYHRFHLALILLLPLADNLIVAATLYKVKLQTTGWIEVAKSLLFLGLMIAYF